MRLLSETIHSTSSSLQLVQGLCSTTLHRTLRALHDWQAFEARLLTLLWILVPVAGRPASLAFRFELGELEGLAGANRSPLTDESDMMYGSMVKGYAKRSRGRSRGSCLPLYAIYAAATNSFLVNQPSILLPHDPPPHVVETPRTSSAR